jgi:BASS family bile acid:Na+ symporter
LGSALATKHFAATPMVAVPSAISAVVHCILGSILAGFWRSRTLSDPKKARHDLHGEM